MDTWSHSKGSIRLVLGCSFVVTCLSGALHAEPALQLSGENGQYEVAATAPAESIGGPVARRVNRQVSISISDKKDGGHKQLAYRQSFRNFKELVFCAADKVALIGELPHGGDCLTILDAKKGQVQDEIRAYGYSISPSKQFLVYKTWYARLGPTHLRKSVVLIYDLANSASANRPPNVEERSFRNAGFPVFPEANVAAVAPELDRSAPEPASSRRPYDVNLDDPYVVTSPFLWSEDSKRLVFFAHNQQERKNYLVRIDLTDGIDKVAVARQPVNLDDHIKWEIMTDLTRKELAEKPYALAVKSLRWGDEGRIIVETNRQYWLDEKFEMPVPQSLNK